MGHTGLVTHEGSEVDWLLGVILREGLDLSHVSGGPLSGQEPEGTVSWSFELSVRHLE